MADFEHLIAARGGLVAALRNNQAKVDASLKEIREEILAKMETNQKGWKPTKKRWMPR
jgi:hypothetical protein